MLTANFHKGTLGATIAATDAGDDTKFDSVSVAAGCAAVYDTDHGVSGNAAKLSTGATGQDIRFTWNAPFGAMTEHYGRQYLYLTANPSAIIPIVTFRNAGGNSAFVYIQTTGAFTIGDVVGSGVASTANGAMPLNQLFRLEYHFIHSLTVGQAELRIYDHPFSTTASASVSTSNQNFSTAMDEINNGIWFKNNIGPLWMSGVVAAATDWVGPVPVMQQPGLMSAGSGIR